VSLRRRCAMRCGLLCRVQAMPGLMATGSGAVEGMSGDMEFGKGRHTRVLTGPILTTITTGRAGLTTRVIGAMKTTATTMTGDIAKMLFCSTGFDKKGRAPVVLAGSLSLTPHPTL
jgi:hypothetical protein